MVFQSSNCIYNNSIKYLGLWADPHTMYLKNIYKDTLNYEIGL